MWKRADKIWRLPTYSEPVSEETLKGHDPLSARLAFVHAVGCSAKAHQDAEDGSWRRRPGGVRWL
jgi:hypothetical protein